MVFEKARVSFPILPESEIIADDNRPGMILSNQGAFKEILGGNSGERPVKFKDRHPFNPVFPEQGNFFGNGREEGWVLGRKKEKARRDMKRDRKGSATLFCRPKAGFTEDPLVSPVNPVKRADRDDRAGGFHSPPTFGKEKKEVRKR